jgi:L-histidine Nalpha-methyltransferase
MDHTATHAAEAVDELKAGFALTPKALPPKYFYDERGSELFEEITRLPEYYPTRTERALLERWVPEWVARLRPATVVELGAGSAAKTRVILDAAAPHHDPLLYMPMDISADFLAETARTLREDRPELDVQPLVGDLGGDFRIPLDLPAPRLIAFLGSTIGNFQEAAAVRLLEHVADGMHPGDAFLIGFDLHKDATILERAYDDSQGVTARFNLNMLHVLNSLTGADFRPEAFRHRAFYDQEKRRIEMHLVSEEEQTVSLPDGTSWTLRAGETIRTEISCKYDRESAGEMLGAARLRIDQWVTDPQEHYALALATL